MMLSEFIAVKCVCRCCCCVVVAVVVDVVVDVDVDVDVEVDVDVVIILSKHLLFDPSADESYCYQLRTCKMDLLE